MYWLPCCSTTPPWGCFASYLPGFACQTCCGICYMMLPVTKLVFAPSLAQVATQELYTSHSELKYKETKEQTICLGTVPAVSWLCCVCYSWCLCGNGESRPAHVVRIILWVTTRVFPAHAQHTQNMVCIDESFIIIHVHNEFLLGNAAAIIVRGRPNMYWQLLPRLRLCRWSCCRFSAQGALRMDSRINIVSHEKWSNEWMAQTSLGYMCT